MRRCFTCLFHREINNSPRAAWIDGFLEGVDNQNDAIFNSDDMKPLHPPFSDNVQERIGTTEDVLQRISSFYRPDIYAYSLLSASNIIIEAYRSDIIDIKIDTTRFFVHPVPLIRNPAMFSQFFGVNRSHAFSNLLSELLRDYDTNNSSLVQVLLSHGVDLTKWLPLLRGLCLCASAASDPVISQFTFLLEDLLLGNEIPNGLNIPGDYHDRGISIADMLMETGVEFGLIGLSQLSLHVYRQFLSETPYPVSKRLAICISRSERRYLDWNLRCFSTKKKSKR